MAPDKRLTFIVRTKDEDEAAQRRRISSINSHTAHAAHERRRRVKGRDVILKDSNEGLEGPALEPATARPQKRTSSVSSLKTSSERSLEGRASSRGSSGSAPLNTQSGTQDPVTLASRLLSTVDGSTLSTHGIDRDVTRRLSGNVDDPINPEGSPIDSEDTESPHVAVKLALSKHQRHHYEAKQLLPLINSALDPFLHLAETVTPHEKNLLRYYNTALVPKLFGTRVDAQQCPGRQLAIPAFQTNPVFIQAIIVVSEHFQSLLRGRPPPKNMFKRRADAYKGLNATISKPQSSRDDILLGMIGVMFTDFILGRSDLQKMHVEALDIYISRQGGIRTFISEPAVIVSAWYVAIQYGFVEFPLRMLSDVEDCKTNFLKSIRNIKHGVNLLREKFASLAASALSRESINEARVASNEDRIVSPAEYKAFVKAKSNIDVLTKPLFYDSDAPYVEGTFTMSLLLGLGLTFFELGSNLGHMTLFLNRLRYMIQQSLVPRETGDSLSMMTASMAALVDYVRKEIFTTIDDAEYALVKEVALSSATIDALKVFSIMNGETRGHIITHLRSWVVDTLMPPSEDACACGIDDGDFSSLSLAIMEGWIVLKSKHNEKV